MKNGGGHVAGMDSAQRSRVRSDRGVAQQMRTVPSGGGSSGSGEYWRRPSTRPLSQVWHTPLRHDHLTGTEHASASSKSERKRLSQRGATPLLRKVTLGPVPWSPAGNGGAGLAVSTPPGGNALAGQKPWVCTRDGSTRHAFGPPPRSEKK